MPDPPAPSRSPARPSPAADTLPESSGHARHPSDQSQLKSKQLPKAIQPNWKLVYDPALDPAAQKKSTSYKKRYAGQGWSGPVTDPRVGVPPKPDLSKRPQRWLDQAYYSHDSNSVGPPPPPLPCGILVSQLSALTTLDEVVRHFGKFGRIAEQDLKLDPKTGMSLGICFIRFQDKIDGQDGHLCALDAVKRTHGSKIGRTAAMGGKEGTVSVELDADGSKAKSAARDEWKRRHAPKETAAPASLAPQTKHNPSPSTSHNKGELPKKDVDRRDERRDGERRDLTRRDSYRPDYDRRDHDRDRDRRQYDHRDYDRERDRRDYDRRGQSWRDADRRDYDRRNHPLYDRRDQDGRSVDPPRQPSLPPRPNLPFPSNFTPSNSRSASNQSTSLEAASQLAPSPFIHSSARSSDSRVPESVSPSSAPLAPKGLANGLSTTSSSSWGKAHGAPPSLSNIHASPSATKLQSFQPQLKVQSPAKSPRDGMEIDSDSAMSDTEDEAERAKRQDRDKVFFPRKVVSSTEKAEPAQDADKDLSERALLVAFSGAKPRSSEEQDAASRLTAQKKLAGDGKDHIRVSKATLPPSLANQPFSIVDDSLRKHLAQFKPAEIFGDPEYWYITFVFPDGAQKAHMVLDQKPMNGRPLAMSLHQPPPFPKILGDKHLSATGSEEERQKLIERSKHLIYREVSAAFEQDLRKRVIQPFVQDFLARKAESQATVAAATTPSTSLPSNFAITHPLPAKPMTPVIPSSPVRAPSPSQSPHGQSAPSSHLTKSEAPDFGPKEAMPLPRKALPSFQKRKRSPAPAVHRPPSSRSVSPERPPARSLSRASDLKHAENKALLSESIRGDTSDSLSLRHVKTTAAEPQTLIAKPYMEPPPRKPQKSSRSKKVVVFTSSDEDEDMEDTPPVQLAAPLASPRKEIEYTSSSEDVSEAEEEGAEKDEFQIRHPRQRKAPPKAKPKLTKTKAKPMRPSLMEVDQEEKPPVSLIQLGAPEEPTPDTIHVEVPEAPPEARPLAKLQPVSKWANLQVPEGEKVDPFAVGLAVDDEDVFYLQQCLQMLSTYGSLHPPLPPPEEEDNHVHPTGSARTEGYYKIQAAAKSGYLPQRNRAMVDPSNLPTSLSISRNARAQTRRLVVGVEQQRSKAASDSNDVLRFNQLRHRKKQLKFARSRIHDWGLYAMEYIPAGDLIVEYVGEYIRQQIADRRERQYERMGIGSSYLFRVDDDFVVDATKKGSMSRLINHSCDPNCIAKIINVNGLKKIGIYARIPIEPGDELTYDYKFASEADELKIPCLCGAANCRKYLN